MVATLLHDKFWSRVAIKSPNECWFWTKGKTGKPGNYYGRARYEPYGSMAHRVSYAITKGSIPEGKHILHSCDNGLCCNPNHLRVGTPADNMRDKVERGRARGNNIGWPKGKPRNHAIYNQTGFVRPAIEEIS